MLVGNMKSSILEVVFLSPCPGALLGTHLEAARRPWQITMVTMAPWIQGITFCDWWPSPKIRHFWSIYGNLNSVPWVLEMAHQRIQHWMYAFHQVGIISLGPSLFSGHYPPFSERRWTQNFNKNQPFSRSQYIPIVYCLGGFLSHGVPPKSS